MNILLSSTGADMASGAAKCLVELAIQLKKREYNVLVTIPQKGDIEKSLIENGINYVYVHEYHSWYISEKHKKNYFYIKRMLNYISLLKMIKIIHQNKIDIIHVNALTAYLAGWAGEICGVPVVWHIREFMEEDLGISFFDKQYSIRKINKAQQMIAISQAVAEKWKHIFSPNIEVIYDGVPVHDYYIQEKELEDNIVRIMIYGRIVPQKGQLFFFEGVKKAMQNTNKKIECYWCGKKEDEQYFNRVKKFIDENGMSEITFYMGQVSDMKPLLRKMNIVCVCSDQEGFGRVTVEAMLAKCIVIGASSGGTKELINDGETGFLYKTGDVEEFSSKLVYVIDNSKKFEKVALRAQEYAVNEFLIENNVNEIIKVYLKSRQCN